MKFRDECIQAVGEKMGKVLNAAEARKITNRVLRWMRKLGATDQKFRDANYIERFDMAAEAAAKEIIEEKRGALIAAEVQLLKLAEHKAYIEDAYQRGASRSRVDAVERLLLRRMDFKSKTVSLEYLIEAKKDLMIAEIADAWRPILPKAAGLFANKAGEKQMLNALAKVPNEITDPAIVKLVGAWEKMTSGANNMFRAAGGSLRELDDFGWHQKFNPQLLAEYEVKHGRDRLTDVAMTYINRKAYFDDNGDPMTEAQLRTIVSEAIQMHKSIGYAKPVASSDFAGQSAMFNRLMPERVLHFTPEGKVAMFEMFGGSNVFQLLMGQIDSIAKMTAAMEVFGMNPDNTLDVLLRQAAELDTNDPSLVGKLDPRNIDGKIKRNKGHFENMMYGPTVLNYKAAAWSNAIRSYSVANMLGGQIFSMITDKATMVTTALNNGQSPLGQLFAGTLALSKGNRDFARRNGLMTSHITQAFARYGYEKLDGIIGAPAAVQRVGQFLQRASGGPLITDIHKAAAARTFYDLFGTMASKYEKIADMHPSDKKFFAGYGFKEADFGIFRQVKLEGEFGYGKSMLTPNGILQLDDSVIAEHTGLKTKVAAERYKRRLAEKYQAAVYTEMATAVIEGGEKQRHILGKTLDQGSFFGEIAGWFSALKTFPLSWSMTQFDRGYKADFGKPLGRAQYVATLVPSLLVFAALSIWMRDLVFGRNPTSFNPEDEAFAKNVGRLVVQSGGLGPLGDFLFADYSRNDSSIAAYLSGPGAKQTEDVFRLTVGNVPDVFSGKDTKADEELLKFARANAPGSRLFYLKPILDRMIWNQVEEMIDPGGPQKRADRMVEKYGMSREWWGSDEMLPDEAPDLTTAFEAQDR